MLTLRSFVWNFVFGPLLIYGLLIAHVTYQVLKAPEDEVKVDSWPSTILPEEKAAIIKGRKAIINDFLDLVAGKNKDFSSKHCTDDVEFEDPMQKFMGMKEFDQFIQAYSGYCKDGEIQVFEELHSPHEIVLDIEIKIWFHILPNYPWVMRQRNHYLLEPPATKGGSEKVFRIFEEWGGNPLLNEKTTQIGILGKVHSKLRRFTGYALSMAWQKGLI